MIPGEQLWRSPTRWVLAGLLLTLGFVGVGRLRLPDEQGRTICFLRLTTGIPCPGCGLTRGISALARRELGDAVRYHPLAPLLAVEAAGGWVYWGFVAFKVAPSPTVRMINLFLAFQVPPLLLVWIYRLLSGQWPPG